MTTKDICKVHYLSCVEAYFGAWIKDFIELPLLYGESYISWNDIVNAFNNPMVNYANFPCIPRIQDLAERIGIVTHRKEQGIPQLGNKCELILLSVNESFFQKQRPWRIDHYIAVEELTAKKLKYLNEYPLEAGELTIKEFNSKFGGDSLIFSLSSTGNHIIEKKRLSQLQIPNDLQFTCDSILPIQRLRDAIGILRVSRRRTAEWVDWYSRQNSISNLAQLQEKLSAQIKFADNCYLRLQSAILRNNELHKSILQEMTERLADMEIQIKE